MRARSNSLRGIVNGIDYQEFNPATDPLIAQNYDARTFRKEKIKNKRALQAELGLEQDDRKMMIGIVSRLTDQKGLELAKNVMRICSVIMTGSIMVRYLPTFIIPRRYPIRSMRHAMHF